jgi:heme/copper-type cytochrome/quinol oxidase subunit 2
LKQNVVVVFAIAIVLAMSLMKTAPAQAGDQLRVIELIADKDNTFKVPGQSKPVITLRPGEKFILRITSYFGGEKARDNALHSFVVKKLRDQGWDLRLYEGTRDYTLVAPAAPGEYFAECTVKCGRGHDDMNMKVRVRN